MNNDFNIAPEINFIPCSLEETIENMIINYEKEYEKLTGQTRNLQPAENERVILQSTAYMLYQAYCKIDYAAKMNFIKYAEGEYLENLGAMMMVKRLQPKAAITKVRFMLSDVVQETIVIKKGTRIASDNRVMFATTEECYINKGEKSVDTIVTCTQLGTIGNGILQGKIHLLVDPIKYVTSAVNLEVSQGGADLENDDNLRMRIYMKPDSFSVAGPKEAYMYFAFSYSQNIADCKVDTPSPGKVNLVVMLKNGELPASAFLDDMKDELEKVRPLTDQLEIFPPEIIKYNINIKYYLGNSLKSQVETINSNIEKAVNSFVKWQKASLGRDINSDELIRRLLEVGAKRVEIISPTYKKLLYNQVAIAQNVEYEFGGFEND